MLLITKIIDQYKDLFLRLIDQRINSMERYKLDIRTDYFTARVYVGIQFISGLQEEFEIDFYTLDRDSFMVVFSKGEIPTEGTYAIAAAEIISKTLNKFILQNGRSN